MTTTSSVVSCGAAVVAVVDSGGEAAAIVDVDATEADVDVDVTVTAAGGAAVDAGAAVATADVADSEVVTGSTGAACSSDPLPHAARVDATARTAIKVE